LSNRIPQRRTRSRSKDINTTLNTFFLVAGSTGAAMLPVVELDLQPSAAMAQESYYLVKATSLFTQQNLPEIQRGEFAGGALMALPVGTVRPACSLLWAYLAEWCDVMVFFLAPRGVVVSLK
jgi:hypothetical protein